MKKMLILLFIPFFLLVTPVSAEKNSDLQEEIIYDILIDRFNVGDHKNNEQTRIDDPIAYHGGDLPGIIDQLDQIKQNGFTTISLSSIMENAPDGYHGYWIEDFYSVEKQFGTMDDFKQLIEEAHKRDIKVILELVTNYVAKSHPFTTDTAKENWFKPNTIKQIPATEWLENVQVLDQDNDEVSEYLIEVADYWLTETNIDGFKLHDADQSSQQFLERLTEHLTSVKPDLYLIAGMSSADGNIDHLRDISAIQAIENNELLEKLNEVFTEAEQPVEALYDTWFKNGQHTDLIMIDNKKTARYSNNTADNGRNTLTTWKLALTYMYTMPGTPMIYQGSEIPMFGPGFPENQMLVQFSSTNPDLKEFLERISALRHEFPALQHGDFELVGSSGALSVFKRTYEDESIYIAINNDVKSQIVPVTDVETNKQLRGVLGDDLIRENDDGNYLINIPRESVDVFIIEENSGLNWLFIGLVGGVFITFVISIIYLTQKQKRRENK